MIYHVKLDSEKAKAEVLSTIFFFDPSFKLLIKGEPQTFWINTTMNAKDIEAITGVEEVERSILNNM